MSRGGPRRVSPGEPVLPDALRNQAPYGIFIATAPDEFYMAGSGVTITFAASTPGPPKVGLATVEEGRFVDGRWIGSRPLAATTPDREIAYRCAAASAPASSA